MKNLPLILLLLWLVQGQCLAVEIVRLHPAAVRPGGTVEIEVEASGVLGEETELTLWTNFPARSRRLASEREKDTRQTTFAVTVRDDLPLGFGTVRVVSKWGISAPRLVVIDNLPTIASAGKTDQAAAQPLAWPVAVEGVSSGLESHYYRIAGQAGQRLDVDVLARRLGSGFDAHVRLLDSGGNALIVADDDESLGADCRFSYAFTQEENLWLEVRDVAYRDLPYRLRVDGGRDGIAVEPPLPGGTSTAESGLGTALPPPQVNTTSPGPETLFKSPSTLNGTLQRAGEKDTYSFRAAAGETIAFRGLTRSLGSPTYLRMEILDAAGDVLVRGGERNTDEETLVYTFSNDDSKGREYRLRVSDLLDRGGAGYAYRVEVCRGGTFAARLHGADRLTAVPGGEFQFEVQCERQGYSGPIAISVRGQHGAYEPVGSCRLLRGTTRAQLRFRVPPNAAQGSVDTLRVEAVAEEGTHRSPEPVSTTEAIRRHARHLEHVPPTVDGDVVLKLVPATAQCTMSPVVLEVGAQTLARVHITRPLDDPSLRERIRFTVVDLPPEIETQTTFLVPAESTTTEVLWKATALRHPSRPANGAQNNGAQNNGAREDETRPGPTDNGKSPIPHFELRTKVEGISLLLPALPLQLEVVKTQRRKRL